MLFTIILVMALGAYAADLLHFRRQHRRGQLHRWAVVWAIATDSLPLVSAAASFLLRDNSTAYMSFIMWVFWLWMTTVLPRMAYYVFNFLHLPRVGIAAGVCLTALFVWGATAGRTTLRVSRVEVCSERLPEAFDGLRVVQLSDIHIGTIVCPEKELQRIADSVEALKPDLVVFTGDLVNIRASELDERARRILGGIKAPYGVFSVTGNHDVGSYIKDSTAMPPRESLRLLLEGQRAMGWCVLNDSTVYLRRSGDSISLTGIAYDASIRKRRHDAQLPPANLPAAYRGVPDSIYNITLAHLPQLWEQFTAAGHGDLTLSGHVHSMQTKVRLFGWEWSPAKWLYERWSGLYESGPSTLYINDGTGYVAYPMRLGAYPEITLITLKRCA